MLAELRIEGRKHHELERYTLALVPKFGTWYYLPERTSEEKGRRKKGCKLRVGSIDERHDYCCRSCMVFSSPVSVGPYIRVDE